MKFLKKLFLTSILLSTISNANLLNAMEIPQAKKPSRFQRFSLACVTAIGTKFGAPKTPPQQVILLAPAQQPQAQQMQYPQPVKSNDFNPTPGYSIPAPTIPVNAGLNLNPTPTQSALQQNQQTPPNSSTPAVYYTTFLVSAPQQKVVTPAEKIAVGLRDGFQKTYEYAMLITDKPKAIEHIASEASKRTNAPEEKQITQEEKERIIQQEVQKKLPNIISQVMEKQPGKEFSPQEFVALKDSLKKFLEKKLNNEEELKKRKIEKNIQIFIYNWNQSRTLDFSYNDFGNIKILEDIFSKLSPEIRVKIFAETRFLNLSHCNISQLPNFLTPQNFPNLKMLALNGNDSLTLEALVRISQFHSLRALLLNDCKLQQIPESFYLFKKYPDGTLIRANFPNIEIIYIKSGNNLPEEIQNKFIKYLTYPSQYQAQSRSKQIYLK